MHRPRRSAVWMLSWTLAFPGNTIAAAIGTPSSSLDSIRRGASQVSVPTLPEAYAAMPGNAVVQAGCSDNPIVCENALPGVGREIWDLPVADAGDPSIQGFATDISVNRGGTIGFKVDTSAMAYRLDIYRLGYYGGDGARLVDTVAVTSPTPPVQPACRGDASTGLLDCGNWSLSASWNVPASAVSGIYLAKLVRDDTQGASHIVFVVRNDDGRSDLLFQTSDTTWQAYNDYGGNSLYKGSPAQRAYKVSYNRPFSTRNDPAGGRQSWVFGAEYPMLRWLESNGYDVSYTTGVDTDRRGQELLEHNVFLSVGHDEYWSGAQRASMEAARAAGVHLAFFSGNDGFWKTRWEPSIDSSGTSHRTLVCYKETHANGKIDPSPASWTGTWRDARPFNPQQANPENALIGTLFTVNGPRHDSIAVPAAEGKLRFWRHTMLADLPEGQWETLAEGSLGYEWNEDIDNGFRPPGLLRLSSTTLDVPQKKLVDYGTTYRDGTATHSLTLYRHRNADGTPRGLVFSAGTVQWSWGLDHAHDFAGPTTDSRMQQATVNLFADMGVQPGTLQSGLVLASMSADVAPPTSAVASPAPGSSVQSGGSVTISGTAADVDGVVGGVEVSVDAGQTWHRASGRETWSYRWTPVAPGTATITSRAADDSGNIGAPSPAVVVTVNPRVCPCSIWDDTATPTEMDSGDSNAVELGVKFQADTNGFITGLRFFKTSQNVGPHVGNLWTSTGALLASVTFAEETSSGWQQALFPSAVPVSAGVTYVASYHTTVGRYARSLIYFHASSAQNAPLRALQNTPAEPNGVYRYGAGSGFPTDTFDATNYWVDVVFDTDHSPDTTSPTITGTSPADGATNVSTGVNVRATFSEPMDASTISPANFQLRDAATNVLLNATVTYASVTRTATVLPASPLATSTTYSVAIDGAAVKDVAGNPLGASHSWSFTTAAPGGCPCTIFPETALPEVANDPNTSTPIELGVKFRVDTSGFITALRFYKGIDNVGPHVGHLWTGNGTLLAEATFAPGISFGWQEVLLDQPVAVSPGTTYVASYHTSVGRFSKTVNFFAGSSFDRPPLSALAHNGDADSNGVFKEGASGFPTLSFNATNYWVDVVFNTTVSDTTPPAVVTTSPARGDMAVSNVDDPESDVQ